MQPQPVRQADQAHSAPAPKVAHAGLIIVATSLGLMMDGIDLSGVSVANPVIAADLHANLSQLQWVTNGYLLAMAVALITAGKLGDRFGHRRIFLVGMIGFAVSSGLVGLSTHITTMIVFRILQGLFGAALMPNSLAILRLIFPPDELKRAIGFSGGMVALATTGGPAVGGVIVDYLGWRWIFFTNLPVAAIVVGLTLAVIPGASAERITRPRIDVPGVLLLAVSLGGLVWGLIASPVRGWSDPEVLAALVIAAIAAVLFVVRQQTTPSPLLPLDLFRSLPFSAGASILVLTGMAIFGTIFYLVFYLQHVKALSPSETGFVMLACTAMFIFSAPASGILNQRFGARLPLTIGSALIIAGAAGLLRLGVDSSVQAVWPFLMVAGLGMGFVAPTAVELVLSSAPEKHAGVAGGVQHTAGILGTALGTAVFGVLVAFRAGQTLPGHLSDAGVPPEIAGPLSHQTGQIAQAAVPLPAGTPAAVAARTVHAAYAAFLDGLDVALFTAIGVGAAALVISQFVRRPPRQTPEKETAAA